MIGGTADRGGIAIVAVALLGVGISVYLTVAHYTQTAPACLGVGAIDCSAVTTSSFSLVPGTEIPITFLGLLWFFVSGTAGFAILTDREPSWLRVAHLAWVGAGLLVVLYLVYAELVVINRICEWCTAVHVLVLTTFLIALRRVQKAE